MINPMNLSGKHILITGASAGIGREVCKFATQLGAKTSIVARNENRLNETLLYAQGPENRYYVYDLNDVDNIPTLISQVVNDNGPLDGLVHCAGISNNRPIKLSKPKYMAEMMQIHFLAFAELLRVAMMRGNSNNGASFIGISSTASIHGNKTQGGYAAAKAAMNGLVHPYAKEAATRSIRINTVAFGMVDTDMYQRDFLDAGGNDEELLREQFLGVIPVAYAAQVLCFMLSDISKYMSGNTLFYDSGAIS